MIDTSSYQEDRASRAKVMKSKILEAYNVSDRAQITTSVSACLCVTTQSIMGMTPSGYEAGAVCYHA